MDIDRLSAYARDPARTRAELERMRSNALAKKAEDFVRVVDEVLQDRFRGKPMKKSGGKTPTTAVFRSRTEHFESGKEAYLWLVQQLFQFHISVLEEYHELHTRAGERSRGKRFARNPADLFPENSKRRCDPRYYSLVGSGWYADVNLNHDGKFAALLQLSYLADLEYERDWDFRVLGGTQQLVEHQQSVVDGRKILEELLAK